MARTRRSDLRTEAWGGEGEGGLVVYDPRSDRGYLLNPATATVFEACNGTTTSEEMATRVAARTGLPADVAIVDLALVELMDSDLLEVTAPEGAMVPAGMSRRTLIARLALGAGAVAFLPVVDAIGGVSRLAADAPSTPSGDNLVAVDKTASTPAGTPVAVTLSTTGGFSDPDVTEAFRIESAPAHGTVDLVGAVATYTPAAGFAGVDSFTYIAWQCVAFADVVSLACPDGTGPVPETGTNAATVTIRVTAPEPPAPPPPTPEAAPEPAAEAVVSRPRFTG